MDYKKIYRDNRDKYDASIVIYSEAQTYPYAFEYGQALSQNNSFQEGSLVSKCLVRGHNIIKIKDSNGKAEDFYPQNFVHIDPKTLLYDGINAESASLVGHTATNNQDYSFFVYLITKNNSFFEKCKELFGSESSSFSEIISGQQGTLNALGLACNSNDCIVSYSDKFKHYLFFYSIYKNVFGKSCYKIADLTTPEPFKKVGLLSKSLGFGLSQDGNIYSIHLNNGSAIELCKKNITDSKGQNIIVKDFALNATIPYWMIFTSTNNDLFFINLKESKKMVKITENINVSNIWFNNQMISYLNHDDYRINLRYFCHIS